MFAHRRDGVSIQPVVIGPAYDSSSYGRVDYIDASAILGDRVLHTFLINRSLSEKAEIEIDHAGGWIDSILTAEMISGSGQKDHNTYEKPDTIIIQPLHTGKITDGKAFIQLPPLSFATITFKVK